MNQNKIIQAIQVDGKNIADIFKLPCVESIEKSTDRRGVYVKTFTEYTEEGEYITKRYFIAVDTDWLCQLQDGTWEVLDDEQYKAQLASS